MAIGLATTSLTSKDMARTATLENVERIVVDDVLVFERYSK